MTLPLHNGEQLNRAKIPQQNVAEFRQQVIARVREGARVAALFGLPGNGSVPMLAVLANGVSGKLELVGTEISGEYPALTPDVPQVHLFERELAEQCGVIPKGHPWLKPVRFVKSLRPGHDTWGRAANEQPLVGVTNFYRVEGDEVHEVAVGPVHAGVIEPGHFRFQCHGEDVLHLEISLGYQHRGVERALVWAVRTSARFITWKHSRATRRSGTHSVLSGHRGPGRLQATARPQVLRGIALELERLANHTGDLGALAGDVGYLPTQSYCGRIARRFPEPDRAAVRQPLRPWPGCGRAAWRSTWTRARRRSCASGWSKRWRDVRKRGGPAVEHARRSGAVRGRRRADDGSRRETRAGRPGGARVRAEARRAASSFPSGIYRFTQIPVSCYHTGDVFARAYVRWLEIQRSAAFILAQLESLPEGPIRKSRPSANSPDRFVVSMTEGWRGEICHVAI
jgi:hypothetical protein